MIGLQAVLLPIEHHGCPCLPLGAEVKVVMTLQPGFRFSTGIVYLSRNKVLVELADEDTWANHVMLGRWQMCC